MSRYSDTKTKRDKSGVQVYTTTFYPNIPISDSDQFIYPLFGERLDSLANKYYGDPNLWWIISKANGLKGVINIPKDTQIRIPGEVDKILEDFRKQVRPLSIFCCLPSIERIDVLKD